jgi:energy-converting hydrogenase Eha subunit E
VVVAGLDVAVGVGSTLVVVAGSVEVVVDPVVVDPVVVGVVAELEPQAVQARVSATARAMAGFAFISTRSVRAGQ